MSGSISPSLPPEVVRYFRHALGGDAGHTPVADVAVKLRMHGEIKLRDRWWPFRATEWLAPHRGFVWRATVRMGVMWISGSDRYVAATAVDGGGEQGSMLWKMFGLFPVQRASGADIARSARGRCAAEAIWAPRALRPEHGVDWRVDKDGWLIATWLLGAGPDGRETIRLRTDGDGRVLAVRLERWGNPDETASRAEPFGATVEEEATFAGVTVPSCVRVGWWPDGDRAAEGEFFRATVDDLEPARWSPPR